MSNEFIELVQMMSIESDYGFVTSYVTDGYSDVILLNERVLYCSEWDAPGYKNNGKEKSKRKYLIKQIDQYINELKQVRTQLKNNGEVK